jgi:hypothetical protein
MVLKNACGQSGIFAPEFDESVREVGHFYALLYACKRTFSVYNKMETYTDLLRPEGRTEDTM